LNIRSFIPLFAVSLTAFGCAANTLDLDTPPTVEPSAEPGVLGIVHDAIVKIAVDDQRLYWVGSTTSGRDFVQSCEKQDCASSIVTYDAQASELPLLLSVTGGQLYWRRWTELMACPIDGCNGSPRSVVKLFASTYGAFVDDDRFYFSEQTFFSDQTSQYSLHSVPLTGAGPRQLTASSPSFLYTMAVDDIYAYGLTGGERNYDRLFRTRKDGTSAVETIAKDVKHAGGAFSVTTDPTSIYWTNNVLAGSINRCPLAGCSGASEVVTGPLRAPQHLLIDGSDLYYVYEAKADEYALAVCALPACAESLLLFEKLVNPDALAIDEQYLYLATSEQAHSDFLGDFPGDFVSRIRRLPKPNRELP